MEFPEQVKFVRTKLNLSQMDLAKALNVSFATINRWENGKSKPNPLALKAFGDFCDSSFIVFPLNGKGQ